MPRIDLADIDGKRHRFGDATVVSIEPDTGEPNRDNSVDYIVRLRSNLDAEYFYHTILGDWEATGTVTVQ